MLVEAAKKAREYLRRAGCRQLEAGWAVEACRIILEDFSTSQEAKGYKPHDPQMDCDLHIPEDTGEDVPNNSTLADAGEKRAAEHWKGAPLTATMNYRMEVSVWLIGK